MRGNWIFYSILGLVFAASGYALVQLVKLRFEYGDNYPWYSSLRTDPLGTKVFYESLEDIDALHVERSFQDWDTAKFPEGSTVLVLGLWGFYNNVFDAFDDSTVLPSVMRGSRLVIAYRPHWMDEDTDFLGEESEEGVYDEQSLDEDSEGVFSETETVEEERAFGLLGYDISSETVNVVNASRVASHAVLPEEIPWRDSFWFTDLSEDWRVLYAVAGDKPVVIERSLGKGSVVLVSDSYWVSNEALFKNRQTAFLKWILSSSDTVIFDEAHFGIIEHQNIATLLRRYRLFPFIFALGVVAALFIWKNSVPLLPASSEEESVSNVIRAKTRSTRAGFDELLVRFIQPGTLLETCVAEWKKNHAHKTHHAKSFAGKEQAIRQVIADHKAMPKKQRSLAKAYNRISTIINSKSTST